MLPNPLPLRRCTLKPPQKEPVILSEVRSTKPKDLRIYDLHSSNQMRRSFDSANAPLRMTGFSCSEITGCCAAGKVKGASRRSPTTGFSLSTLDWGKPECVLCPSSVSPAGYHLPPGEGGTSSVKNLRFLPASPEGKPLGVLPKGEGL